MTGPWIVADQGSIDANQLVLVHEDALWNPAARERRGGRGCTACHDVRATLSVVDPSHPDDEPRAGHPEHGNEAPDDAANEPSSETRSVPNPYITAVGVVVAIIVIFALSDVAFVVRLVIAFAIVAGAAYLSIVLARRH